MVGLSLLTIPFVLYALQYNGILSPVWMWVSLAMVFLINLCIVLSGNRDAAGR